MVKVIILGINDTIRQLAHLGHMNHTKSTLSLGIITIATGKYYEEFIPTLKNSRVSSIITTKSPSKISITNNPSTKNLLPGFDVKSH